MKAIFLTKDPKAYNTLKSLEREAIRDGVVNVARRIRAIIMNMDGWAAPEISVYLTKSRCQISEWIRKYRDGGIDVLLEGRRSGRPAKLTFNQLNNFYQVLQGSPAECGIRGRKWTLSLIEQAIWEKFQIKYHRVHLRKILNLLNFSIREGRLLKSVLLKKVEGKSDSDWEDEIKKLRWLRVNSEFPT